MKKCRYCDFLSGPQDAGVRERYVKALICEIRIRGVLLREKRGDGAPAKVDTVFIGGGTPSLLTVDQILRIMEALRKSFDLDHEAEISMEMNPGTLQETCRGKLSERGEGARGRKGETEEDCLRRIRDAGINRLSIGVQSFQEEELRLLGRIHSAEDAKTTFWRARAAGFQNINLDLMSALPGQTMEKWMDSLEQAVGLGPEHLSAYSLIIEPGTEIADMIGQGSLPPLPDEEAERAMFHETKSFLEKKGYLQYEISNYARPGKACRHNRGYWTGHPYLGLGIGAASCLDGARFSNTSDLSFYLRALEWARERGQDPAVFSGGRALSPGDDDSSDDRSLFAGLLWAENGHVLSETEKMEEFMFLGLRMTAGIRSADFAARFQKEIEEVYGDVIRRQLRQGVLRELPGGYCLSQRGVDVSNYVLADYLL